MRALCLLLVLSAASVHASPGLTVASKKFTENVILAEIAMQLLAADGIGVEHRQELGGTRILWNALLAGKIDIYPEYTGTLRQEIFAGVPLPNDEALSRQLKHEGILMTAPLGFNNSYVLGMLQARAAALQIKEITDLHRWPQLRFGLSNEFISRGDGWSALRQHYGLPHTHVTGLDHDLAYRGLVSRHIDVIDLYATDAEIDYYKIQRLRDDKQFFTEYQAIYLYREQALAAYPGLSERLALVNNHLNEHTMTALNRQVKIARQDSQQVVADFLRSALSIQAAPAGVSWVGRLYKNTLSHLYLVIVSLSCAILIAVPAGIVAAKQARLGQVLLAGSGVLQTVPALALFVFLIPLLGIGTLPAIVALFLYSLLPIIRNTASGIKDIQPDVIESAIALGLPAAERLQRIELPLALRSIMSGIKTAAVMNVGLATLGALIGAGGYGQPILTGIRLDDTALILDGAIPAAVLALSVQGVFDLIEHKLLPTYSYQAENR